MSVRPDEPTSEDRTVGVGAGGEPSAVQVFQLTVVGPAPGPTHRSSLRTCSIGSHKSNDLVLSDATVSRFHCELVVEAHGVRVRDLGSRNGTRVDGTRVTDAWIAPGSHLRLGHVTLRFDPTLKPGRVEVSEAKRFGGLVGASVRMRAAFALLERAAASDVTVLLEAETGTGKGAAAEALHQLGPRREHPFVVVDCGAVAPTLLESELFGHEKGAFTGADARRIGAFEDADKGTIFLDEIGELPVALQPKLLRAIDKREIRRLGQNQYRPVDVRVIAATNRDLRASVNDDTFRADLYYRLAVIHVCLPPLRERLEDIPLIVSELLDGLGAPAGPRARLAAPEFLASLERSAWPGNVRELRNHLERCLVLADPPAFGVTDTGAMSGDGLTVDTRVVLSEARRRATETFERRYLMALLAEHGGKVASAARAAGVARVHLYRLLTKHGLRP